MIYFPVLRLHSKKNKQMIIMSLSMCGGEAVQYLYDY